MEGFSIKKDLEKNFNDYRNLLTNYLKKRYYQDLSDEDIDDIVSNTFVKALRFEDKYVCIRRIWWFEELVGYYR